MGTIVAFESADVKVDNSIEAEVARILAAPQIKLPRPKSELVDLYFQKITGTYNVERAKNDTDNAIDLLYIAYNTTPQEEGANRVKIANLMTSVIRAQQESELAMERAVGTSKTVVDKLSVVHPDWLDVREVGSAQDVKGVDEIKAFLKEDVIGLAEEIRVKAQAVQAELEAIARTYDVIIQNTVEVTSTSEKSLAERLKERAQMDKEINEATAKREQLDALVKDLQVQVDKYETSARRYEERAQTAEERAFVMSIVQVGAQVMAAALPAVVTGLTAAATGGTSVIASAAAGTVNRTLGDKNTENKPEIGGDKERIETQKKIADKASEAKLSEKDVENIKNDLKGLEAELKKETEKTDNVSGDGSKKDDSAILEGLKGRVEDKKKELGTAEEKYAKLVGALAGLQASLAALDAGLGKMSDEMRSEAGTLREMQMKMLDKVETYEKERSAQNGELAKINALLKGKRGEQETIQLTIRSLNLSISALKRMKEIVEEIAFFFKSFASFMKTISEETQTDINLFNTFSTRTEIREKYFQNLIVMGDKFFIRETAQWDAIGLVCRRFCDSFAEGWTKLNKLSGKYIVGEELQAYFDIASDKLKQIVEEREAASRQKLADINGYRKKVLDTGTSAKG